MRPVFLLLALSCLAFAQTGRINGIPNQITSGAFTTTNPNGTTCTVGVSPNLTYTIPVPATYWQCSGTTGVNAGTYQAATPSVASTTDFLSGDGSGNAIDSLIPLNSVPTSYNAAKFGTSTTGISSAVTACGSSVSCVVVAGPTYGTSEAEPVTLINIGQPVTGSGANYALNPNVGIVDLRVGHYEVNADSLGVLPSGNYTAYDRLDYLSTVQVPVLTNAAYNKVGRLTDMLDLGGGINVWGTYGVGEAWVNKTFYVAQDNRIHGYTAGQKIGVQSFVNSYGVGDALGFYAINTCYAGFNAGTDEGCEAMDVQATQGTQQYTGQVTSATGSSTTITVNASTATHTGSATTTSASTTITGIGNTATAFGGSPLVPGMGISGTGIPYGALITTIASGTSITISAAATASGTITATFSSGFGDGTQGEGRYLLDLASANVVSAGSISCISGVYNYQTSSSCANAAAYTDPYTGQSVYGPAVVTGTGTSWAVSNNTTITGTQNVPAPGQYTVTVGSITGITTSTPVCVADPYNLEQVLPSSVGSNSFTATFRYPHPLGAFVSNGGLACHYLVLTADIAGITQFNGSLAYNLYQNLWWALPIIKSTSSTSLTLWLQSPDAGFTGYRGRWNGLTATGPAPYQSTSYAIYPGAQVTSVMTSQKLGSLTLEVPLSVTNGDTVVEPQYHNLNVYAALHSVQRVFPQTTGNPAAWWLQLEGLWTDTDTAMAIANNTAASVYSQSGHVAPQLIAPTGSWQCYLCITSNTFPNEVIGATTAANYFLLTQPGSGGYSNNIEIAGTQNTISFGNFNGNGFHVNINMAFGSVSTGTTANTDLAGQLTLSGTSQNFSFNTPWSNAPLCVASDTATTPAAANAVATATTLTVYGTSGHTLNYVCIGRY